MRSSPPFGHFSRPSAASSFRRGPGLREDRRGGPAAPGAAGGHGRRVGEAEVRGTQGPHERPARLHDRSAPFGGGRGRTREDGADGRARARRSRRTSGEGLSL